jgi:hypothetical protein
LVASENRKLLRKELAPGGLKSLVGGRMGG